MPRCKMKGCKNFTQYQNTKQNYCLVHSARIRRHGYPELKKEKGEHALEKLPHKMVDNFILRNYRKMFDEQIAEELRKMGFKETTTWNVRYRRRRLGVKKYLYGEIQKHKAWIRTQAIKKYGNKCELCFYKVTIDTHHIIPKYQGGAHELENLMVVCPNCHALITRKIILINNRKEIPKIRNTFRTKIKFFSKFLIN